MNGSGGLCEGKVLLHYRSAKGLCAGKALCLPKSSQSEAQRLTIRSARPYKCKVVIYEVEVASKGDRRLYQRDMISCCVSHMGCLGSKFVVGHQGGRLQPVQGGPLLAGSHVPLNCTSKTAPHCQVSAHKREQGLDWSTLLPIYTE